MHKSLCKCLRRFFGKFDFSGSPITFRYDSGDKWSTCLIGFFFLIYIIFAFIMVIVNLVSFGKNKNFILHYYMRNLKQTENLNLYDKSTAFAFGLDCRDERTTKQAQELFDIKVEYKERKNEKTETKHNFSDYHFCKPQDFMNELKDSFNNLKLKNYFCLNKEEIKKYILKGIFSDKHFEYYSITLSSKNDSEILLENINSFLLQSDCKMQYFYTDVILDIDDFSTTITYFMDSLFLQINPHIFNKKNIFYFNYHLYNYSRFIHDSKWIFFSESDDYFNSPRLQIGLSRTQDYFEYKGLNRTKDKSIKDRTDYARIYLRADNKKIEVKRHYQDIMEFYADNSILIDFFNFFCIIIGFLTDFLAKKSLAKKLFFYEKYPETMKNIKNYIKINIEENSPSSNISERNLNISKEINNNNNLNNINTTTTKVNEENKMIIKKKKRYQLSWCNKLKRFIFFCFDWTFTFREDIIEDPVDIIDNKLDVVYYIKNMLFLELINNIEFNGIKNLANFFISLPLIESKKNQKRHKGSVSSETTNYNEKDNEIDDLYKRPSQLNINEISQEITNITHNQNERDYRIINIFKEKIKF